MYQGIMGSVWSSYAEQKNSLLARLSFVSYFPYLVLPLEDADVAVRLMVLYIYCQLCTRKCVGSVPRNGQ